MINARLVVPRDVTQEVEQPTYLVTFWSQPGLSRGIPSSMLGWSSSEWDVQGGDLDEVLDRARDAPGRTCPADRVTVALLYDLPDGRASAQIWLLGDDPRGTPGDAWPSQVTAARDISAASSTNC